MCGWDFYRRGWGVVLAAVLVGGCTWTRPWTTPPPPRAESVSTPSPVPAPGPSLPQAPPATAGTEQAAALSVKLAASEEEKANLLTRITNLQAALEERDRAFRQASAEVQSACEEMARARLELQRWKQEAAGLNQRVQNAEKENVATLQTLVLLLEKLTERTTPAPAAPPAVSAPPLPPPAPAPTPAPQGGGLSMPRAVNPELIPMPREQPFNPEDNLPTPPGAPGKE